MLRNPTHPWLLRLCDPQGARVLPARRLNKSQFVELLALADQHGVTGTVLANLTTLFAREGHRRTLSPTVAAAELGAIDAQLVETRRQWFEFVATTLLLRQRTTELLDAFAGAGVTAAVVKGEDFADRLYRPAGLRPFRDVDLMLSQAAMHTAGLILRRSGYREVAGGAKHESGYGEQVWDSIDVPKIRVELHWNLINSPAQRKKSSLAFEELQWTKLQRGGRQLLRAQPASMLLIACVHAVLGHRFDRLQHLCDIRQICRGVAGRIDFSSLREMILQTGTSTAVQGALEVAGRMLDDLACSETLEQLQLTGSRVTWRLLVSDATLLAPYSPVNKFRRTIVREWMKRAA